MGLGVVVFLHPLGELAVERLQRAQVQLAAQELFANGAEKPFHFAFGGSVAHGSVVEQAANPGANLNNLLGGVDGTVVHVKRMGHPAFVESGAHRLDEGIDIFGQEELAVGANPRGVIDKGNQPGSHRPVLERQIRPAQGVGLPHFIGVSFGKSQADLIGTVRVGFEQFILFDDPAKRVGRDLGTGQQPRFNAEPIDHREPGEALVQFGQDLLHRFGHVLQRQLANFAFVGPGLAFHHGHAVLLVTAQPSGDGFPGELPGVAFLIGEGHLADRFDAVADGFALGHVDGPVHTDF
jgi:hypothetical protein